MEILNVYISVLLPLINCFIDSTCASSVYCNMWPLEREELKHLMPKSTFCFFTPQHFFLSATRLLVGFLRYTAVVRGFQPHVLCFTSANLLRALQKTRLSKVLPLLCILINRGERRVQTYFQAPGKPWTTILFPPIQFNVWHFSLSPLCFNSWPVRCNERAKYTTLRLSGDKKSSTDTNCWSCKENQHV